MQTAAASCMKRGNMLLFGCFEAELGPAHPRVSSGTCWSLHPALPPADKIIDALGIRQHLSDRTRK